MKFMMHVKGFCLAGLCMMAVFAVGAAGSASAAPLLFIPHAGKFPYHFVGTGGTTRLVTAGGSTLTSPAVDILALVLSPTLFDTHLEFLKVTTSVLGGGPCSNVSGSTETVLANVLGHFGFADPGNVAGVLLLIPGHITFTCTVLGVSVPILIRGSVIGTIDSPALNVASELLRLLFNQTNGVQNFRTFLLNNETLTGLDEQTAVNGGAFELSGQESEAHLLALPGQGTFLLVSP